jgi:hypothetical protein
MTYNTRRFIMAKRQPQGGNQPGKDASNKPASKVGSESEAAKNLGGKGDFGVPESDTIGRAYTSANTRASDPGAAQPHAGDDEGRVAGVGSNASGPGSGSGGDLDTDIVGIGTGAGVSQNGAGDPPGPDDATGSARDFASGPPTKNYKGPKAGKIEGSTVDRSGGDIETTASGRGAQAVSRPDPDDDAFAGEISMDEAAGQDSH